MLRLVLAVVCVVAVPAVYSMGMSYGAEYLVWDPTYSTYYYEERPAELVVIVVALVLCAALGAASVLLGVKGMVAFVRAYRVRYRRTGLPNAPA
jgi:hypothetical protein